MSLPWASYRLRLPLSLSVTAIATALCMALAVGLQTLHNLREDQSRNALALGHAMGEALVQALRHDDVWLAYSLLRGPGGASSDAVWIVADPVGRIFASNLPRRYRLDQSLSDALPWLRDQPSPATDPANGRVTAVDQPDVQRLLHLSLISDGTQVGELIALLSDAPHLPRLREILIGGALVVIGGLAVILPLGWLWGRRMVAPLTHLAACMTRIGREDPRQLKCSVPQGDSEIGQLGRHFYAMVSALGEKEALEQRMVQAERLAAVGRVAAGVAHEVNNPLGGMLMAIDTYRCTHAIDAPTGQLLDLLDRALHQIQGAVSALLVEARADGHTLTQADLEDVRTLAQPKLAKSGIALTWEADLHTPTGLPAAPVRQLLLNLLLNAIQAARGGGTVRVHIGTRGSELLAQIENSGEPLPPERLAHLFEPYPQTRPHEPGLGLWVCYQIAAQLGGEIEAQAEGETTRVQVRLPLRDRGAA